MGNHYNADTLRGTLVSDEARRASWNLAVTASATSAVADLINDVQLMVLEGGPQAIPWRHADQVDTALLGFQRG